MRTQILAFTSLLVAGCTGAATTGHVTEEGKSVYTSAVTQLVLDDLGGGYAPPPPPGAQCTPYSGRYTLTVAGRTLTWDICQRQPEGANPSFVKETGTRTLGADEWSALQPTLQKLVVGNTKVCGADKPFVELTVSTGDGDLVYGDSFYGCEEINQHRPVIETSALGDAETALAALAKK
jgi:hypothetical protein